MIETLRKGASAKRSTRIFRLVGYEVILVRIALSQNPDTSHQILGFGADICPLAAERAALREMALMELNLQDLYAVQAANAEIDTSRLEAFL